MTVQAIAAAAAALLLCATMRAGTAWAATSEMAVSAFVPAMAGTCLIDAPGRGRVSPARAASLTVVSCSGTMPYEVLLDAAWSGITATTLECGTTERLPADLAGSAARKRLQVTYSCPSWSKLNDADALLDTINATLSY